MKFLGLFLLAAALYMSWGIFNGETVLVSESVHMEIQQNLSKEIVQLIAKANPEAYNIEVLEFSTETLDEKNIEASFKFAFEEESGEGETKVLRSGKMLLTKIKEEKGTQYWDAKEVSLGGQRIEFKTGITFYEGEAN